MTVWGHPTTISCSSSGNSKKHFAEEGARWAAPKLIMPCRLELASWSPLDG